MTAVRGFLEKLSRPAEEIRAENLRTWASTVRGSTRIHELQPRQRGTAAGVIQNIRIDPREGSGSVEATITDGTGELIAKWLGRSSLAGITLGKGLVVEGTSGVSPDGFLVILNPEYQLVPGPEHG